MDIRIGKSARVCRACERDFVHEETVNSLVRVQEKELLREDFCPNCWRQDRAADAYSHWSTKYYDPRIAEQGPPEAFSPLRQLFYEAVEAEERVHQAKAFLAAQLLRRQKVFRQIKESDEADGEVKIILFNDRIGNRLIEVRDPNFTYAELEEGRQLLMQRLMELEAPEPAPAQAPPASTVALSDSAPEESTGPEDSDPEEELIDEDEDKDEDEDDDDDDDEEYDDDDFEDDDDDDDDEEDDEDDDDDDDDELEEEAEEPVARKQKKENTAHVQPN